LTFIIINFAAHILLQRSTIVWRLNVHSIALLRRFICFSFLLFWNALVIYSCESFQKLSDILTLIMMSSTHLPSLSLEPSLTHSGSLMDILPFPVLLPFFIQRGSSIYFLWRLEAKDLNPPLFLIQG
jgi:hypothetical protein